jgi:hypothetical protein
MAATSLRRCYRIEPHGDGLRVQIPVRTHWRLAIFLGVWLIGWGAGMAFGLYGLQALRIPEDGVGVSMAPTLIWLLFWVVSGLFVFWALLWHLFGSEMIDVTAAGIRHQQAVFGAGPARAFAVADITLLSVTADGRMGSAFRRARGLFPSGPTAINLIRGARVYPMARGLNRAEARAVLVTIARRFPSYAAKLDLGDDG